MGREIQKPQHSTRDVSEHAPAPQPPRREPLGTPLAVGVAGIDRTATHLLELVRLRPDFCAPAVFDPEPAHLPGVAHLTEWAGSEWPKFVAVPIDVVVVCGRVAPRHATAAALLQAGRHVVLPPPVCATLAEAESLRLFAEATGTRLGVLRLDDGRDFWSALAEARSGRLGRICTVRRFVASAGLGGALSAADVLAGFGPTDLSQLIDIVADEPARVFAVATPGMRPEDSSAGFVLTIRFRGGAVASIGRSVGSVTPEDGRWSVSGSDGGYANGVRWQRGEDDEIFPLADSPAPRIDPLESIARLAHGDRDELREAWQRAVWTVALLDACGRALASGREEAVGP